MEAVDPEAIAAALEISRLSRKVDLPLRVGLLVRLTDTVQRHNHVREAYSLRNII
jgi:hypothetical protein